MKKILLLTFISLAYFTKAQDCSNAYITDVYDSVTVETVQFGQAVNDQGQNQDLFMDIYDGFGNNNSNKPVIIFAFGGSFIAGERTSPDMVFFATEFAKKGYLCASIDYRIASSPLSLFAEETVVKTVIRAAHDGKAAIRFFRQDAATNNVFNIDSSAIFIGGTSAGGILAEHIAYLDDVNKLSPTYKAYVDDLPNGLEGESGNPGYCSMPNGVFGFAGAITDTAWIDANDVPIYSTHSEDDATVPYESGRPLGGLAPVTLYGSNAIKKRMDNLGTYNVFDSYGGDAHPPFNSANQAQNDFVFDEVETNLTAFLNNIIYCNPNNLLPQNAQNCNNTAVGISESEIAETYIYPNPANTYFSVNDANKYSSYNIYNLQGNKVATGKISERISIAKLKAGAYIVHLNGNTVQKLNLIKQ